MGILRLSEKELEEFGFRFIDDGEGGYWEYVLDETDYFHSDYIYSEQSDEDTYRLIQYKNGEHRELNNLEFKQLITNENYKV